MDPQISFITFIQANHPKNHKQAKHQCTHIGWQIPFRVHTQPLNLYSTILDGRGGKGVDTTHWPHRICPQSLLNNWQRVRHKTFSYAMQSVACSSVHVLSNIWHWSSTTSIIWTSITQILRLSTRINAYVNKQTQLSEFSIIRTFLPAPSSFG